MKCDAVLIAGNCIVNESMLTGESVPVTKIPLTPPQGIPDEAMPELNLRQHSRNILFCGTEIIQTRFYGSKRVRAVVIRTGFATSKGELVRSILYPKPVDFKFERDSYYFVACFAMLACFGFIYTIVLMVQNGDEPGDIIVRSLDLITITVPPSLPAALAIGVVFSQRRLKGKNVYCISPRGITICGTINTVCFDKTGTITEDKMDVHGAVPVEKGSFGALQKKLSEEITGPFLAAMTTCHSLTIVEGKIMGDPLDLIMFTATNWDLIEPGPDETRFDVMTPTVVKPKISEPPPKQTGELGVFGEDIGIVRQFPFSSSLQRMSVVTRKLGAQNFELYVKGSPETICSLSKPETVPFNFHNILQSYTQQGYRVIALAWKPLASKLTYVKVQRLQRETIENDLTFLGLLVMENRLKPQSAPVIDELREANIRTVMVTGDNMLTALSVARACRMVDRTDRTILVQAYPPSQDKQDVTLEFVYANNSEETVMEVISKDSKELQIEDENQRYHFALTGKTWGIIRKHCPNVLERIVVKGSVFARMAPDQKAQVIEVLQDVGYYVGMCGDGANDCGALKAAHMGISLSEAEASVASPFTSKTPTIECVPSVIKEGRAALVTSFGIFKYIACYSLTQFTSVLILYWIGANLTDGEFLYIDLFLITSFSITFSRTGAFEELVKERPYMSLFNPSPFLSIITQMAIVIAAQAFVFLNVKEQPWFLPFRDNDENDYKCYENFAVFIMSTYQYVILAITFSKGAPFRKSFFSNWLFMFNIVVAIGATIWVNLYPPGTLIDVMELKLFPPMEYRAIFIGIAGICFSTSYITEKLIVDNDSIRTRISDRIKSCIPSSEPKYHTVESEIVRDADWPPVSKDKVDLAEIFQRLDSVDQPPPIPTARQSSMDYIPEVNLDDSKDSNELTFSVVNFEGLTECEDIPSVKVVASDLTTPEFSRELQGNTYL